MDNITRMIKGMAYIADETLVEEMKQNKRLTNQFNTTDPWEFEKLDDLTHRIFSSLCKKSWFSTPF